MAWDARRQYLVRQLAAELDDYGELSTDEVQAVLDRATLEYQLADRGA